MVEFRATIEEARGEGGAWIRVPPSIVDEFGGGGRIPVQATFDGLPYRGSVVSMGGSGRVIGILKGIRDQLGKEPGDEVLVTLESDEAPREVEVPLDLEAALKKAALADEFAELSFTRRKAIASGVAGAKKPKTRRRRIDAAIAELGKR